MRSARPRALLVSFAFYPGGAIGAHRAGKLAKYLPACGWDPVVLTLREEYFPYLHPVVDARLLDQIPPGVHVIRTGYASVNLLKPYVPRTLRRLGRSRSRMGPVADANVGNRAPHRQRVGITRWFEVPEDGGWIPYGLVGGLRAARCSDVIWATAPPAGGACLAALLSRLTGRPLIVDLRDPWCNDAAILPATPIHGWIDRRWERFVLCTADRIVVVTDEMNDEFRQRFPALADRISVIYNGFDPEDFEPAEPIRSRADREAELRVGYFGGVYQGRDECMLRFLEAARRMLSDGRFARVRFVARGTSHDTIQTQAQIAGMESVVDSDGPISYAHTVGLMKAMDVLLVVGSRLHAYALPGKVFEYLGARRPVLAITPPGALSRFVETHGVGEVADPDVPGALETALARVRDHYEVIASRVAAAAERFSRRGVAQRFASLFTDVIVDRGKARRTPCVAGRLAP